MSAQNVTLKKGNDIIYPQTLASNVFTSDGRNIEEMVTQLVSDSYYYQGIAIPTTNPGTPSGKVFYFASTAGVYTNFNSTTLPQGLSILQYNGTGWVATTFIAIIDNLITGGANNALSAEQGKNLKALLDSGYIYLGFASPGTYPTPSRKSFYFVSAAGVYNFYRSNGTTMSVTIADSSKLYVFTWNSSVSGEWNQTQVFSSGYVAPVGGIPASDLESSVQVALNLAVTAYQKPDAGIPKVDFTQQVRDSLDLADSAVQARTIGGITPPVSPGDYVTTQSIVNNLSTGGTSVPLSAEQGKTLNLEKVGFEIIGDAVEIPS